MENKGRLRHAAEMANIARGEAKCYISIKAKFRMLYFTHNTWQGYELSVMKNFLNIHSLPLNIPSLPTLLIHNIESGQKWFIQH